GQSGRRRVQRQEVISRVRGRRHDVIQGDAVPAAAVLGAPLPPGVVHQDVTHGFGRCGEEVAAAVPVPFQATHQAEISLVDQGGGLESLSGLLVGQFLGGQPAQLLVDQRQDAAGGGRIAVGNSFKKLGDLV